MAFENVTQINIQTLVADVTALKAVATGALSAEHQALVADDNALVWWQPNLITASSDSDGIIRPDDVASDAVPGRWVFLRDALGPGGIKRDTFTATSSQDTFSLSQDPGLSEVVMVVDGFTQNPADYSVSGTTVTYTGIDLDAGNTVTFFYGVGGGGGGGSGGGGVSELEISDTLSADVNDYNPTDWDAATIVLLSTDGSDYDITGATSPTSSGSVRKSLFNTSSNVITLINDSASSTAANRFDLPGDLAILPKGSTEIVYDSTNSRWRAL